MATIQGLLVTGGPAGANTGGKVPFYLFLIKKRLKILSVPEKVVPLHPQNGTRMS
jgi:hypothetical protein